MSDTRLEMFPSLCFFNFYNVNQPCEFNDYAQLQNKECEAEGA